MKLRTSLQVSAIFPILLGIMVSLSLFLRARQLGETQTTAKSVEALHRAATELHIATYESLLHRTPEARENWLSKSGDMSSALDAVHMESIAGQIVLDRSKDGVKQLNETYAEFYKTPENKAGANTPLGTELIADSENLLRNSLEVARITDASSEDALETADLFFAVFIGVMGLVMAGATLSISRDVLRRVALLSQWTRTVSAGNTNAKISIPASSDEVGELARDFVVMTQKLSSAGAAMEKEIAEHKKAANALRGNHVLLSNAMEMLKRAQQQIIQQERTNILKQTIGGIVHDFRNTLTPIVTMSEFLELYPEKAKDSKLVLELINTIQLSSRRAWDDLNKLSAVFSPSDAITLSKVDLNALVVDVGQLMGPQWREEASSRGVLISMETELGEIPPVTGDETKLKEMLSNVIMNALEALPQGGLISVRTVAADDRVTVEVQDTGKGMSEEVKARCLEPFFSTKGVEGTGMGLTVVQSTIRDHGGSLEIDSAPGKGTTVRMSLRKWEGTPPKPAAPLSPLLVRRALWVLLIDDEPWVRDMVAATLEAEGCRVDQAGTGEDGLTKLAAGRYDLVITDRAMPDMTGDDIAVRIKKTWPALPVILFTGFGKTLLESQEKPEGIDVVLAKPATRADILAAVAEAMVDTEQSKAFAAEQSP